MRAKKLLALLLSGAFFAGCLSGCDRTVIEHQFHTNTEYVTGEETSSPEIERNLVALANIFFSNGVMDLAVSIQFLPKEITMEGLHSDFCIESEDDLVAEIDDNIVNDFVHGDDSEGIVLFQEYGAESECDSFVSACSKLVGILSEKLKPFTKEDWAGNKDKRYSLIMHNFDITDRNNKTYASVGLWTY